MSLLKAFLDARDVLGLTPQDDAPSIKRAYRRATVAHPPDRDPEGFRRVRDAYELLTGPIKRIAELLVDRAPHAPPPRAPSVEAAPPAHAVVVAMLRAAVGRLDASVFDAPPPPAKKRQNKTTTQQQKDDPAETQGP